MGPLQEHTIYVKLNLSRYFGEDVSSKVLTGKLLEYYNPDTKLVELPLNVNYSRGSQNNTYTAHISADW